jgi:hypothetical protein
MEAKGLLPKPAPVVVQPTIKAARPKAKAAAKKPAAAKPQKKPAAKKVPARRSKAA